MRRLQGAFTCIAILALAQRAEMQRGIPDTLYRGLCMRQIPHNALDLSHKAPKLPCGVCNLGKVEDVRCSSAAAILALTV